MQDIGGEEMGGGVKSNEQYPITIWFQGYSLLEVKYSMGWRGFAQIMRKMADCSLGPGNSSDYLHLLIGHTTQY